jgi:hypothetical protein
MGRRSLRGATQLERLFTMPFRFSFRNAEMRLLSQEAPGCPIRAAMHCFQPGQRSLCSPMTDFFPSLPVSFHYKGKKGRCQQIQNEE